MSNLTLTAYKDLTPAAIKLFWSSRKSASEAQKARGISDQGNRSGVTSGKNMDGFVRMVRRLIIDNGVPDLEVLTDGKSGLCLPGFFRPTKNWDLLVVSQKQLIAAVEFKSQVGPSFGNNFNNRVEEALGNATDLRTAYREGVFKPVHRIRLRVRGLPRIKIGCQFPILPFSGNARIQGDQLRQAV